MFLVSFCSGLCTIHWSQVLSREWRCSWSSADRRCSNYIWVINNFIAYWGAIYIRGFVDLLAWIGNHMICNLVMQLVFKYCWLNWWGPMLNAFRQKQNSHHFADDISKSFPRMKIVVFDWYFTCSIKGPINNMLSLVQLMAWSWTGNKPLSEPVKV